MNRWKVIGSRFGVPAVTFVNAVSESDARAEALRESGPGFDAVKHVEPDTTGLATWEDETE